LRFGEEEGMGDGRADSVPEFLQAEEYVSQRGVVREEFDLAGAIKENVVI
jgi:hypothetical protein